jgi:hypothetical protein
MNPNTTNKIAMSQTRTAFPISRRWHSVQGTDTPSQGTNWALVVMGGEKKQHAKQDKSACYQFSID